MADFEMTEFGLPIDHKTPPTTVREVGIHLIYISKNMAEINGKLEKMSTNFATRDDLTEAIDDRKKDMAALTERCFGDDGLNCRLKKIENTFGGIIAKVAVTAIIILVVMVLAVYGLDKYLIIG